MTRTDATGAPSDEPHGDGSDVIEPGAGHDMLALAARLFPIHRTLINDGYDESIEIIRERLDVEVESFASGAEVWDWVIPHAWNVREAWVEAMDGTRLVDVASSNLHLSQYSVAVDREVPGDELRAHLNSLPDRPDAIPYNYHYYDRTWSFNVRHRDRSRFDGDRFRVRIDVDESPGTMKVLGVHLPGTSGRDVLLTSYLCHPSLANDNLSGVVTLVELVRRLAQSSAPRRVGVRLAIWPETIGAIAWLARHDAERPTFDGALVVYDCGDRAPITYKQSWFGEARIDRAARHVLRHHAPDAVVQPWHPSGSDERQFNAPGVRVPAGAFMRSPAGAFPQYHTSLDTLDLLDAAALEDSARTLARIIAAMEMDRVLCSTVRGEPCFSRRNLAYPTWHGDRGAESRMVGKHLIYELDGTRSLVEIAERINAPIDVVAQVARAFEASGVAADVTSDVEASATQP